jgi:hypothetical protein
MPRPAVRYGFRDVTLRSGIMPRKPIGDRAMADAERQVRHRATHAAGAPVIHARRPITHRGRVRRWHDAVAELTELQAQYIAWLQAVPDNLQDGATAEVVSVNVVMGWAPPTASLCQGGGLELPLQEASTPSPRPWTLPEMIGRDALRPAAVRRWESV